MITINDIKIGDIVKSTVFTFSQKYLLYEGYAEYNCSKEGTVIKVGETFFNTIIITEEGDEIYLASDPGSSGDVIIEIIKKD
jgi:hypothetical protein